MMSNKIQITTILRKNQTPWEVKLWSILRNRGVENLKFRRQFRIGRYVADFCCLEHKLVVELDGGHHNIEKVQIKDKEKQKYIESQGYKVLRFWNNEIDENFEGVIEEIIRNCN